MSMLAARLRCAPWWVVCKQAGVHGEWCLDGYETELDGNSMREEDFLALAIIKYTPLFANQSVVMGHGSRSLGICDAYPTVPYGKLGSHH